MLLNIDPNGKGWIDWAATKVAGYNSDSALPLPLPPVPFSLLLIFPISLCVCQLSGLTSALPDTVLPHLFSQVGLQPLSFFAFLSLFFFFLPQTNNSNLKTQGKG